MFSATPCDLLIRTSITQQPSVVRRAFGPTVGSGLTATYPRYGVEIPEARVNLTYNPTGRAVLCWSTFYSDFNGVLCFVPYQGA